MNVMRECNWARSWREKVSSHGCRLVWQGVSSYGLRLVWQDIELTQLKTCVVEY